MSLLGLLGVARGGLLAQQAALGTVGSNIANVGTPGYARRTAILETTQPQDGVRHARTMRTTDRFADAHVTLEQGKQGAANARAGGLTEIENILAPPSGTIGDQAIAFVASFNNLTGFPIDPSLRADVLSKANTLANTIRSTRSNLEATGASLMAQASDVLNDTNAKLANVADLNRQIASITSAGGDANALRDQRDTVVREVAERIGARTIEDSSGRVTLFAAGAVLVDGDHASPLSMDLDANGALRFFATGASKTDVTSRLTTGTLGGIREARDVDLAKAIADVDAYAFDVANAFNAVHTRGVGLDGETGRPIFAVSTTKAGAASTLAVDASLVGHPERIGAAPAKGDLPGGNTIALELASLADKQAFGGATLADRYAAIATDIGFRKASADAEVNLRADTLAVAQSLSDSASGVSIDEEMVDLSRYQRAFEAQAKIFRAADELLSELMRAF